MHETTGYLCRPGCGACCVIPSISSPIPGMPNGKPAGVPCVQLDEQGYCKIFDAPERPLVCGRFKPSSEVCGTSRDEAYVLLRVLDISTAP